MVREILFRGKTLDGGLCPQIDRVQSEERRDTGEKKHYSLQSMAELYATLAFDGDRATVVPLKANFIYSDGYWRTQRYGVKQVNSNCATCKNRGKYGWCNSVLDALDAPCSYYKDKRTKSVPYFNEPPYYIDSCSFNNLGTALTAAWINADTNVWLNGRHIDGSLHAGTF